ncbi:MAG: RNA polymerase sigma factor, partial [Anaeromyxobacteraceae bacterium]
AGCAGPTSVAMETASVERRAQELLAAGDLAAAATVVIRGHGVEVLRYLRSLLRDEGAATDAFSAWAEDVWRGLPAFRGEASLRGWAFRVAYHAALDVKDEAWRRRGRRLATGEASALADELRTKTVVRDERQRQALEELREALTLEERSLLALRVDQGLSWAETAAVLAREGEAVEPNALMKRFERLKERLGRLAKERGLVE